VCATRTRLGRRRIRGAHRRAVARRTPRRARLQIVRDNRRARRARRPVSGDGEVHQGGGETIASAGPTRAAREFAPMTNSIKTDSIKTDVATTDAIENYRRAYRDFRWETPEHFNFAEVIDKFAEDPRRVAIHWEDSEGRRARLTFGDIAAQSKRIANVLSGNGLKRGDAVLLVLPRITLWQAAYIGALRLGAIVIPCTS